MHALSPRSLVLLFGTVNGVALAGLLLAARANRTANRLLAALLLGFAARLLPYVLGYSGYYDRYPWLSFAPFDVQLAFGPLLWLYVRRVTSGALPPGWAWHLVPAALAFACDAVAFVALPVPDKDRLAGVVERWIDPVETGLAVVSVLVYGARAGREHRAYRRWLEDHLSDMEPFAQRWLGHALVALALTGAVWMAWLLVDVFVVPLDYDADFPEYLWLAVAVYGLGLAGWRHADVRYPVPPPAVAADCPGPVGILDPTDPVDRGPHAAGPLPHLTSPAGASRSGSSAARTSTPGAGPSGGASGGSPAGGLDGRSARGPDVDPSPTRRSPDWGPLAHRLDAVVRERALWRNPTLTLEALARALDTNTTYVSRALNQGLGVTFNAYVNRRRVEAVIAALAAGDRRDLLPIALEAGFNSKASFNRAFRDVTGRTPSALRATLTPADAVTAVPPTN
jgi:AraC-like DNA-binding protein